MKKLQKVFCGSGQRCVEPDKLPHMMSLESVLAGAVNMKTIWVYGVG